MIYYILAVYAAASIFSYWYAMSPSGLYSKVADILFWFAMPCLVFFYIISKIIALPAYLVLSLSKLLRLEPDEAADLLYKMIED